MTDTFCNDMILRRQLANNNIPLIRNTVIPLYPEVSYDSIALLKKIEILKYNNNTQTTKTNNFTKKEKWSRLVNKNVQFISTIKNTNCDIV